MPRLIVPGSYQAEATRFLPYDTAGLEYWGMYDGSGVRSARNHASGKPPGAVFGSPTYNANDLLLTPGSSFIQTEVQQPASITCIAVINPQDDASGLRYLVSNNASPAVDPPHATARGAQFLLSHGSAVGDGMLTMEFAVSVLSGGSDTNANTSIANTVAASAWSCVAGSYDSSTGTYRVYNMTTGQTNSNTNPNPVNLGSASLRIGNSYAPAGSNGVRFAHASIYSVAKSAGEITAIYTKLKAYFAARGIAI